MTEEQALRLAIVIYDQRANEKEAAGDTVYAARLREIRDALHSLENACQLYGFFDVRPCT